MDSKKFHYPNDPPDAKCPYCGENKKPCSHVDSMARAYARGACKLKLNKPEKPNL